LAELHLRALPVVDLLQAPQHKKQHLLAEEHLWVLPAVDLLQAPQHKKQHLLAEEHLRAHLAVDLLLGLQDVVHRLGLRLKKRRKAEEHLLVPLDVELRQALPVAEDLRDLLVEVTVVHPRHQAVEVRQRVPQEEAPQPLQVEGCLAVVLRAAVEAAHRLLRVLSRQSR
jgi:hypothetical protein